ncbi:MAG: rhomboid family intramembrane serine protease [Nitriliruptoraceae bacterium]
MDRDATCARHPGRPAVTVCARCGAPTCADELVEAPVGYQCGACVAEAVPTRRLADGAATPATRGLVAAIVGVALLTLFGAVGTRAFALIPVLVASEPWRLVTSAFLHAGLLHLGFNALLLWQLGQVLEPRVGTRGMLGLTAAGMAGGGLGVMVMAWLTVATPLLDVPVLGRALATGPATATVGASGAVFGLMGAVLGILRRRGVDPRSNPIGASVSSLVAINLVLTLAVPAISVGGHVGGLAAGFVAGLAVPPERRERRRGATAALLLTGLLLVAALALAGDLAGRLP